MGLERDIKNIAKKTVNFPITVVKKTTKLGFKIVKAPVKLVRKMF